MPVTHLIMFKVRRCLLLGLLTFQFITGHNISPRAHTEQGIYVGRQKKLNGTTINYWYGIPYAQQPIGDRRWMPPEALGSGSGTWEATTPYVCPQRESFGYQHTESCLTLNIYTPASANNIPVFVWIHGGSFVGGTAILYDATPFVSVGVKHSTPVVFVTINYRLGLLGFLADEDLYKERSGIGNSSTTGNYGVLDQMMALYWIKRNIHGFGGDPTQITIGGESAGGISVSVLLTSPLIVNDTFQRAIIESGNIWPEYAISLDTAINCTGRVLRPIVNCTTIQCLRDLSVDEILNAQDIVPSKARCEITFSPVIDDYVLQDTMEDNYVKGNFQKVPILVGSNANETAYMTCTIFNETANATQVEAFFKTLYNATIINDIHHIYGSIFDYDNPLTYLNIVYSDSWAHCGSRRIVSHFADYGVSSFWYTYNHILPVTPTCQGAFHVAELLMIFPSLLSYLYPHYSFSPLEEQLSINMIQYWTNFIRTSNPNNGSNVTLWESYLTSLDNDLVLDISLQMRNFYYNFTCSQLWDRYAVIIQ